MKTNDHIFICGGPANAGPITKEVMEAWRDAADSVGAVETESTILHAYPCFETFILCAIQTLELAMNVAPCTGPESEIHEVINQLKKHL